MSKAHKKAQNDYRHGDLRASLMSAALDQVAKTGEVEFSLRDLSQKVGVTHAAAYRHFSSKKDILVAIAQEGFQRLSAKFKSILEDDPKDIEGLGQAYIQFAIHNPNHFRIMFHPDLKSAKTTTDLEDLGADTFNFLLASVETNKQLGRFNSDENLLIAVSAWAAVHGLAILMVNESLNSKINVNSETLAKALTKHLMIGFLKR